MTPLLSAGARLARASRLHAAKNETAAVHSVTPRASPLLLPDG